MLTNERSVAPAPAPEENLPSGWDIEDGAVNNAAASTSNRKFQAGFWNVVALGLSLKFGGLFNSWHNGLLAGFWGYFVATLIVAAGYGILTVSVAEVMSIISFPGGHFAYVRASLGPFWGFIAGYMGLMESMFFLAVSMLKFGQGLTASLKTDRRLELVWWLMGYLAMMALHLRGGRLFWYFMALLTVLTSLALAVYLFGSIPNIEFAQYAYANSPTGFAGGWLIFFLELRLPGWFYIGIDLMSQTSEEVKEPTKVVPHAMLLVMGIMFLLSLWLELTVAGQYPGLVHDFFGLANVFPLSYGFADILNSNRTLCSALGILPAFASCTGYMYCAARQANAMARSRLLPAVFTVTCSTANFGSFSCNNNNNNSNNNNNDSNNNSSSNNNNNNNNDSNNNSNNNNNNIDSNNMNGERVPIAGMLLTSAVGLTGLCFAWFFDPYTMLFRMAVQGGCIAYMLVLASFIVFRLRYQRMERNFTSPIGITGAVVGMVIFAVVEVSVLLLLPIANGATVDTFGATIAFCCFSVAIVIYYFLVVQKTQTFSYLEQRHFLKAYIVNANTKQKRRIARRGRTSVSSNSNNSNGRSRTLKELEEHSSGSNSSAFSACTGAIHSSTAAATDTESTKSTTMSKPSERSVGGSNWNRVVPVDESTSDSAGALTVSGAARVYLAASEDEFEAETTAVVATNDTAADTDTAVAGYEMPATLSAREMLLRSEDDDDHYCDTASTAATATAGTTTAAVAAGTATTIATTIATVMDPHLSGKVLFEAAHDSGRAMSNKLVKQESANSFATIK